ncbi:hypothetical protein GL50803_0060483 [Giardia duodenalis]|uniref:Uncharacterized protein n=1 Tax=Giardia intestinalis (strain ATCC 50803 / WB clone C6) TaxID=184922 RepID=A0A644FDA8_GIAIC|nr:hypothetical protein GL50803_0060483 [Giardia intestinalis]KAE8305880.1 hypothetical protein GL50803_0060483 [Giardia intestinalis]
MKEKCNASNSVQTSRGKPWFIYEPPTTATSSSQVWVVPPLFDGEAKPVRKAVVEAAVPPYWGTDISRTAFLGSSDRPFRHHGGTSEPSIVLSANSAILTAIDYSRKSLSPVASQGKSLYTKPYTHPDLQSYSRTPDTRS